MKTFLFLILFILFLVYRCPQMNAECDAQRIPWEKLQLGQQIAPCGEQRTIKRIPGGVVVTHSGYRIGSTNFIPMKFDDEK